MTSKSPTYKSAHAVRNQLYIFSGIALISVGLTFDPLARRLVILSHYLSSYVLIFCVKSIQHAIVPINKTLKKSQALFQAFKAFIQQGTLTHVTHTWREKKEAIHWIQYLWH